MGCERRARRTRRTEFDELVNRVVDCALEVLSQLGPELLELPYEQYLPLFVLFSASLRENALSNYPLLITHHCFTSLREAQASLFRVQNQLGILDALHGLTLFGYHRPSTNAGSRPMDG